MDRDEVYETLNEVFRDVFDDPSITVDDSTTSDDVDGWDSLTNMLLINEIEKHFNVRFTFRDIVKLKNVGDLCNTILTKTK